jgi:hypothetical protein
MICRIEWGRRNEQVVGFVDCCFNRDCHGASCSSNVMLRLQKYLPV